MDLKVHQDLLFQPYIFEEKFLEKLNINLTLLRHPVSLQDKLCEGATGMNFEKQNDLNNNWPSSY